MSTLIDTLPACPTTLSADQLAQFRADGYLAFRDILSPDELQESRSRISSLIQMMIDRHAAPTLTGTTLHDDKGFHIQFEESQRGLDPRLPGAELKVRKLMGYTRVDPFFRELALAGSRIHGVLDAALGPDSIMFQDMALIKPPRIGTIKPWHQDNAYFTVTPLDQIIGVWIALDDARIENGCMHVVPGGHRRGPLRHYHATDCEIRPDRMDWGAGVPVEVPAGGGLFFFGMLPHMTPPNRSDARRRALQLHYRGAATVQNERPVYDRIFADADGAAASCSANPRV